MLTLIKVYDDTCDVCKTLAGLDEEVAEENGLFFRKITISDLAANPSALPDYVVSVYVTPSADGKIDVPIYLIETSQGHIQASSVVSILEELKNMISAYQKWVSTQSV